MSAVQVSEVALDRACFFRRGYSSREGRKPSSPLQKLWASRQLWRRREVGETGVKGSWEIDWEWVEIIERGGEIAGSGRKV